MMANEITEITRRAIADHFSKGNVNWSGRFNDEDFLTRLYDLTSLPSNDGRFRNAAGDIFQHCVRNNDWSPDWVFYDRRFNVIHATDEQFLRFLCETVHPVVRPDGNETKALVEAFNRELAKDGWEIVEIKQISGRPVFGAHKAGTRAKVFEEPTGWQKVDRQLQEVRSRLDTARTEEQCQAVGLLCREALISGAQEVYDSARHISSDGLAPSATDAKRMLTAIFETEFGGSANDEARRHARAAVELALALQQKRTEDFRTAAFCAEAAHSVVNMLAILAGRRERSPG